MFQLTLIIAIYLYFKKNVSACCFTKKILGYSLSLSLCLFLVLVLDYVYVLWMFFIPRHVQMLWPLSHLSKVDRLLWFFPKNRLALSISIVFVSGYSPACEGFADHCNWWSPQITDFRQKMQISRWKTKVNVPHLMFLTPRANPIKRKFVRKAKYVLYRGRQLFSSAGHISPLCVSRGPDFSQKKLYWSWNFAFRGHYVGAPVLYVPLPSALY